MNKAFPGQYEIWIADLDPAMGSEPGKTRPVVIIQSDLLNRAGHSSIIACPISSQHKEGVSFIRLFIEPTAGNGLVKRSYVLCDQLRAMDLKRLKECIGVMSDADVARLSETLKVILTL
ncbi:MAG TPA: type II toxin-antitoxin system PemK/MazF family toxin [Mucilaginibacter sp.]|nr:type II toxin-antitoxin system PemK/MazF family toxin [Mucilaginibacter sp.]